MKDTSPQTQNNNNNNNKNKTNTFKILSSFFPQIKSMISFFSSMSSAKGISRVHISVITMPKLMHQENVIENQVDKSWKNLDIFIANIIEKKSSLNISPMSSNRSKLEKGMQVQNSKNYEVSKLKTIK